MNDTKEYSELKKWVEANFIKCNRVNHSANSYYLKHRFEDETGIYVTEEAFIKAMDELDYKYVQVGIRGKDSRNYKIKGILEPEYYVAKGRLRKQRERGDI